jgi:LAO/AO transport system kinase
LATLHTDRGSKRLSPPEYVAGILSGDRVALARAITVIESDLGTDSDIAAEILEAVLPESGKSQRVGITGVPGAGKSTFIDALGMHIIHDLKQRVAVLSVDPSSQISGGSILGDKTRMHRLFADERAFIRPSPARGHLGGVARRTRETILLCEAAGYENILIETVGVGQSETAVRSMTDFFLLLMVPGAGDELQGMKRGIIEMLDGMAINKADGDNKTRAEGARVDYSNAMSLLPRSGDGWIPPVWTCSSLTGENVPEIWQTIVDHRLRLEASGHLAQRRAEQALDWMRELVSLGLDEIFRRNPEVSRRFPEVSESVQRDEMTPFTAAQELLRLFDPERRD